MPENVTQLLAAVGEDPDASARLFEAVYADLRAIAAAHMRSERPDHTLQPTALVGEAYLRLLGSEPVDFQNRRHFFRIASEAMRRILIDHARARLAEKRGGGRAREELMDFKVATVLAPDRLLAIDDALEKLAGEDVRAAEIVRLRFYGGMSVEQAAELLEVSARTAHRDWNFARARLIQLMGHDE